LFQVYPRLFLDLRPYYSVSHFHSFPVLFQISLNTLKFLSISFVLPNELPDSKFSMVFVQASWFRWPHGLRGRYAVARLLSLWVRIPPETCMSACCECYVLSGRGFCDELITRPEESCRLCRVVLCDVETS